MLESILVALFALFFAWVAWWKLDWAIVLCIIFSPTYVLRFQVGFLPMTILEVMVVIIIAVWAIQVLRQRLVTKTCPVRLPWRWVLLVWVLVGIAAVLVSPDTRQALGLWKAYILEPVLFFVVLVNVIKTEYQIRSVVWAFGALVVLVGFVTLLQYAGLASVPEPYASQVPMRATSVFPFPTAVGKLLGPLVAFFLALVFTKPMVAESAGRLGLRKDIFPLGVLIFGIIGLMLSFSRGAIFGVFAALLLVSCFSRWKKWLWALIVFAIVVALIVPFTRQELTSIVSTRDTSADVHVVMWKGAVRIIKAHPLMGTGLASFPVVYEKYKEASHTEFFPNPDELYLTLWIEMGLTGLLVFVWLVLKYARTAVSLLRNIAYRHYGIALLAALTAILVHGFFDTPYFKNDLAIIFWALAALVIILSRQPATSEQ